MNTIINWLTRGLGNPEDVKARGAYGKRASMVGLLLNVLLAGAKFLVGSLSGSVSITADAANNLSDASSSLISLLGFKLALRPADPEHPYGHARYEYLAALMVALLIMLIGIELFRTGLDRVLNPQPVSFDWLALGVLAGSILVKLFMMLFYRGVGKRISSQTLFAAAADSRNDVLTTGAVLLAALASRYLDWQLDGWMALAVSLFILYSGFGLIRSTIDPLLGSPPDPDFVKAVREEIMAYPGVLGTHDLMIHDYGPGRRFGSVHVEMDAGEDSMHSHDVIDSIERYFLSEHQLHLVVHMDPIVTNDPVLGELRAWLQEQLITLHPELSFHDLRLVRGQTHSNLIFDVVRPPDMQFSEAELKQRLSKIVQQKYPHYFCVITVDDSYAAVPK